MLNPDFSDRTYTAEVLRVRTKADDAIRALSRLTHEPRNEVILDEDVEASIRVIHSFLTSRREYHRVERTVISNDGLRVQVPRRVGSGKGETCLYDVLIARCLNHIVVAVPFHDLAEQFFVQADRAIAGTGARYEKLDIKRLVIELGSGGATNIDDGDQALRVTRCHLAYSEIEKRDRNLHQIQITGADLGATQQYQRLIEPVLDPKKDKTQRVTPVILGFSLLAGGVRKSSATTDSHGNFKIWISPGLRRLIRLFTLLDAIEKMENIATTTTNVPILQSGMIREADRKS